MAKRDIHVLCLNHHLPRATHKNRGSYIMKNVLCVYDCVRACVCVCVCVANGCTYIFDSLGSEGVKGKMWDMKNK